MKEAARAALGSRNAFKCAAWLASAVMACVMLCPAPVQAQKSYVDGLQARIEFDKPQYESSDPIRVIVTFVNTSDQPLTILKWLTPFEGFLSNMFVVRDKGGKRVRYLGRMLKRGTPSSKQFMVIGPKKSLQSVLDLSEAYEIRQAGPYRVQLRTFIQDFGQTSPGGLARTACKEPRYIESNIASFDLLDEKKPETPEPKFPSFNECTPEDQKILRSALLEAQDIAFEALGMLNSTAADGRPLSARYKEWFGTYSDDRYDEVVARFRRVASAFADEAIGFNCDCDYDEDYASVTPSLPYGIQVCGKFWGAPMSGSNSKSGTILHELSHFFVVADTNDHAYGHTCARYLASTWPNYAFNNADNLEFFAENTPTLEMAGLPGWTSCDWHTVGYEQSHNKQDGWCPTGSFVTGLDLDSAAAQGGANSPIVGQVQCCKLKAHEVSTWGSCDWYPVGYDQSHSTQEDWCPTGSFVTALDLDGDSSDGKGNQPIVAEARCCDLPGTDLPNWGESYWFDVGPLKSHDLLLETWCPAGSFVSQLDLDGGESNDWPVVGRVRCDAPAP